MTYRLIVIWEILKGSTIQGTICRKGLWVPIKGFTLFSSALYDWNGGKEISHFLIIQRVGLSDFDHYEVGVAVLGGESYKRKLIIFFSWRKNKSWFSRVQYENRNCFDI